MGDKLEEILRGGGQLGEKVGEKVWEKVGEKTGEKVGESLGEIDKLNLCPHTKVDEVYRRSQSFLLSGKIEGSLSHVLGERRKLK